MGTYSSMFLLRPTDAGVSGASGRALTSDPPGHLGARPEPEFAQDVLDVDFNGTLGDYQPLGNVVVAQSVCHQAGDLPLAGMV
jgi:hypothetical protein